MFFHVWLKIITKIKLFTQKNYKLIIVDEKGTDWFIISIVGTINKSHDKLTEEHDINTSINSVCTMIITITRLYNSCLYKKVYDAPLR